VIKACPIKACLIKGVDPAPILLFCQSMILSENRHPSLGPSITPWPGDMLLAKVL